MHIRESNRRQRGFASPLAVAVGLLVCAGLGYGLVRGFSSTQPASQFTTSASIPRGALLDSGLPTKIAAKTDAPVFESEEPTAPEADQAPLPEPTETAERPALPDPVSLPKPIENADLDGEYLDLPFAKISNYRYVFPDIEDGENVPDQIPESVKALNNRKVAIRGFMLPVTQKEGRVTEFLLLKDQSMCCFGTMPAMNEWVHVILKPDQSAPMVWDIPVTVFGKFEVGEVFENGVLMTIYRLRFDKLVKPELAK